MKTAEQMQNKEDFLLWMSQVCCSVSGNSKSLIVEPGKKEEDFHMRLLFKVFKDMFFLSYTRIMIVFMYKGLRSIVKEHWFSNSAAVEAGDWQNTKPILNNTNIVSSKERHQQRII